MPERRALPGAFNSGAHSNGILYLLRPLGGHKRIGPTGTGDGVFIARFDCGGQLSGRCCVQHSGAILAAGGDIHNVFQLA